MDANAAQDPADLIAVVGMAGRFPGAPDTESLWRLLADRGDAIRPVPADRWDTSVQLDPERQIQAVGGFIDGVDLFDADFFGVSPREAEAIDPQQRLLLEVSWLALEDAGQRAADLAGTRTGVYIGASWHDYEILRRERGARATPHSLVGNALDVIAARLSYFFGVRGPSLTVETGCSSSLVALHLAAQALRQGEIESAIVGGSNLILDPHVTVGLTHFGGLSPDGRSKSFAASANGFVRGEGVAVLYVKTLERALRDGDRIHGVIVRTVVNNDGGGDSLVTPSREGQEDLLRRAYGDGAVPLDALAYVEAHATGTGRGDPVETTAIGNVLGRGRAAGPLPIGSVKTNIGHLEACAGLAGLFKNLLALRHRTVPPSLHSEELNPEIPFDDLNVRVVREPLRLPKTGPIYLGVSSFGWGGTNAHVVIRNPPEAAEEAGDDTPDLGLPAFLPISAKRSSVLAERAALLRDAPAETPDAATALAGALAWRRDHFPVRAAVLADDAERARAALDALASGDAEPDAPGLVTGRAVGRGRVAFVFPGQGSQWAGMGRELYRDSPLFARVVRRCAEALRPHVLWDPLAVFLGEAGDEWTTRIDMLQPTLWAMSLGLAETWRAAGVVPDVVLGHSQGEITAATFAGILSYEDGALIMARRSAIARRTSGKGRMLAVDLDRDAALRSLEGFEGSVSLAVHNGPRSCVLSGDEDSVLVLKELLEAEGVFCRLVNVDYASHSPQMDDLREDLLAALAPAEPGAGDIELMSTVRNRRLDGTEMDAAYWVENLCNPVLFADAMGTLFDEGVSHVIEVSPHPVLTPAIEQLAAGRAEPPVVLPTLRRDDGGPGSFALALARAYTAGLEPFGGLPRRRFAEAPGHPLHGESHWTPVRRPGPATVTGFDVALVPAPGQPDTWHGGLEISADDLPWLSDHRVYDAPVLPATAMLAVAVNAARARRDAVPRRVENVVFGSEIAVGGGPVRLTAEWSDDLADGGGVRILSLPDGGASWVVNATARVYFGGGDGGPAPEFPAWAGDVEVIDGADFYRRCAGRGLDYGPAFQRVRSLHILPGGAETAGQVRLEQRLLPGNRPHVLHPALWDGALQVALALFDGDEALVPTAVRAVRLLSALDEPVTEVWSHAVRRDDGLVDVRVFDEAHAPVLVMEGLALKPLPGVSTTEAGAERLHRVRWTDVTGREPGGTPAPPGRWAVFGDPALGTAMKAAGAEVVLVADADTAVTADLPPADGVVFAAPPAGAGFDAQRRGLGRLTRLVRACAGQGVPPRLVVVTPIAQAATAADQPDPGAAMYWGYARVLCREHGELTPRVIDVDPSTPGWAAACAEEILRGDGEDQVALRDGRRLAARLTAGDTSDEAAAGLPVARTKPQPFRVAVLRPGRPDGVDCVPLSRRAPGPGEVEVEVTAAALNPTDVLKAVGAFPGLSGEAALLGGECAGRVVAAGPGVTMLSPGDRVAACVFGALADHVTIRAAQALPVPATLGDAEAAGIPLVMAMAWYSLVDHGRVGQGDTVLIHAAADTIGLAAVHVALLLGARVIATADSESKRAHLHELGVADVFDSRDLSWAEAVMAATGGRGVDVVLNVLPGAAISAGLDVLAPDGRFVEAGKQDIAKGRSISLSAFAKGITVSAADANGLVRRNPMRFAEILHTVWEHVSSGRLEPLPVHRRPFAQAGTALFQMARNEHVGRFVLTEPEGVGRVAAVPMPGGRFSADGTYLITGGLGALGLSLARFLAANGAGAVALMSRSAPDDATAKLVAGLREGGTRIETVQCDVADVAALRRSLETLRADLPPLRGVVHAAGLLDDAVIQNMTDEQIARVLAPKAEGARNLDEATVDDPLDLFVLFSSAAALVGNAGQAAYAAGNAYLDALAEARRRRGLPGLSVQWGPFTGIGLAAADEQRGARLEERGMGGITVDEAWPALADMLGRGEPVAGYVPLDLRRWFDAYPDTAALPSWETLRAAAARAAGAGAFGGEFRSRLGEAAPEVRAELIEQKVRELTGRVLRADPARLEPETPFKALGLDSLMSLELRNRLESTFGLRLSPTLLWTYSTTKALAGALCDQLDDAS
ncbi:SDR family NAD(P)-dependent oxidoreductase [Streptosporangium sp. LJ11]|uniref:SDR family NAD(P)-dependent oxidoreductase n=1 Tax=Streptosporangium sp. LJ11 TaxID=3436927 RepID=UPI003F7AD0B3